MKKMVYSLMLFEEIVEKIDQMAYEKNTNRSQLINDILAEKIGMVTPEQKIQQILERLDENFNDTLSMSQINKHSSIQFGKSLKYKYRPKVRYSYEFISNHEGRYAVLKISSRAKSEGLKEHFEAFFGLITQIEKNDQSDDVNHQSNHKFVRTFKDEGRLSKDVETVSDNLTAYLQMMDQAMNAYFAGVDCGKTKDIPATLADIYYQFYKEKK